MKVGSVEGTPQEITDFIVNNGLQLSDYLEKPDEPLEKKWLALPTILLVVALVLLVLLSSLPRGAFLLLFLMGAGSVVWLSISIQIRFKNGWATAVAAIGGLLMILVAGGLIAPKETIDVIKNLKGK
jgi:hypothetical protein